MSLPAASPTPTRKTAIWIIVVAALGYFVDIYDLILFSIVRVQSFHDIGIAQDDMRRLGEYVLNMQMGGLLLGGILWGVIGDRYGRIKVLFGSIVLYSLANIANGFVQDVHMYAIIRFIAGIGLAGELGAGITLVNETMDRNKRGYGTMMVAGIGVLGAIAAYNVAQHFDWRVAYFVGGGMGLALLLLRIGTFESGMFHRATASAVSRGNLLMLFTDKTRFVRYVHCICIGLPIWFVVGILVTLSPEFGRALGAPQTLNAGIGVLYTYLGISIGDFMAGLLAQVTKSRRLTVFAFQIITLVAAVIYLNSTGLSEATFEKLALLMGIGVGYWATFVTIASEQFGTNLRATVTTTAPNFVRGSLIPITIVFELIAHRTGIITSAYIMIFVLTAIALFSLSRLKESFNRDLEYLEQ